MVGPDLDSASSAGRFHSARGTPAPSRRSTTSWSAGLETATVHVGQRKQYEPSFVSEHTRTFTWSIVRSTSPHVGHVARMLATAPPVLVDLRRCSLIGPAPSTVES